MYDICGLRDVYGLKYSPFIHIVFLSNFASTQSAGPHIPLQGEGEGPAGEGAGTAVPFLRGLFLSHAGSYMLNNCFESSIQNRRTLFLNSQHLHSHFWDIFKPCLQSDKIFLGHIDTSPIHYGVPPKNRKVGRLSVSYTPFPK